MPPTSVERNGVPMGRTGWTWDAATASVTLRETNATAYPLWVVHP